MVFALYLTKNETVLHQKRNWSVQNSCCFLDCHGICLISHQKRNSTSPKTKQYYTKAFEDAATWFCLQTDIFFAVFRESDHYSISQEIYTRFLLCCALLWLYIDWFSHIHQASFTGTVAIASKATLLNMDKYFMWIHYERLHNHNKAKHNKTVCIFLGIYCR